MRETARQPTILIVDDTPVNLQVLANAMKGDHQIKVATNGAKALEIAGATPQPDLILLDIMMPGLDGYQVCQRLKGDPATAGIPVIFITALAEQQDEARGLELGAVDYITKPFAPPLVRARVKNQLELKRYRDNLEELVRQRTRELELTQEVTIASMGILAEYRDPETGGHIKRTQHYLKNLAEHLRELPRYQGELDDARIRMLYQSAPLHDIGKVGVPDQILRKPGKLSEEEFAQMKLHASYGRDAIAAAAGRLGANSFLDCAQEIAASHHEKWDGSGYPLGLRGEEIPLSGRLMAVADVYDALISKRVYKPPFSHPKAVAIIGEGRGSHFDPAIIEVFLAHAEDFRQIAWQFADSEEERQNLLAD